MNNYRPISLLSYVDKILEKAMHRRLYSYLNMMHYFFPSQFDFRKHHSTELAVISTHFFPNDTSDNFSKIVFFNHMKVDNRALLLRP